MRAAHQSPPTGYSLRGRADARTNASLKSISEEHLREKQKQYHTGIKRGPPPGTEDFTTLCSIFSDTVWIFSAGAHVAIGVSDAPMLTCAVNSSGALEGDRICARTTLRRLRWSALAAEAEVGSVPTELLFDGFVPFIHRHR